MRRRSIIAVVIGAVALIAATTTVAAALTHPDTEGAAPSDAPSVSASATPNPASPNPFSAGALQDPGAPPAATVAAGTAPVSISIPRIGVQSNLEDLALGPDGQLQAPVEWDSAGWYAQGVVPGQVGPAIIAGHIDSPTAPAVFARISELVAGDEVTVTMSNGAALTFVISGRTQSAKSAFPTAEVYSNVPAPELRLITCAGTFDRSIGHYTDNLILFAQLRS